MQIVNVERKNFITITIKDYMQTVRVPYEGKGYKFSYYSELIDVNFPGVPFINVYTVFIDDPDMQKIVGEHFSIIYNQLINPKPSFEIKSPGSIEEMNLKKQIAQQIINNS
jgi:hypothetical protein